MNVIKKDIIEGGKAFLDLMLEALKENLFTKGFYAHQSSYLDAFELYRGLIPKDELMKIDKKYNQIIYERFKRIRG